MGWKVIIVWECEIRHNKPVDRLQMLIGEINRGSGKNATYR